MHLLTFYTSKNRQDCNCHIVPTHARTGRIATVTLLLQHTVMFCIVMVISAHSVVGSANCMQCRPRGLILDNQQSIGFVVLCSLLSLVEHKQNSDVFYEWLKAQTWGHITNTNVPSRTPHRIASTSISKQNAGESTQQQSHWNNNSPVRTSCNNHLAASAANSSIHSFWLPVSAALRSHSERELPLLAWCWYAGCFQQIPSRARACRRQQFALCTGFASSAHALLQYCAAPQLGQPHRLPMPASLLGPLPAAGTPPAHQSQARSANSLTRASLVLLLQPDPLPLLPALPLSEHSRWERCWFRCSCHERGWTCSSRSACSQKAQSVRFPMRAGFGGLSTWWQQEIGSGHSTWALTVHVRHPMCVRCKELVCPCTPVLGISVKANDHPPPITSHTYIQVPNC